jgi:biofilm PGA synthesis protein PgaA
MRKISTGFRVPVPAAMLLLSCVLAFSPVHAQSGTAAGRHAEAIEAARAGRYAEAIAVLDELRRDAAGDRALLVDAIVVRGWAERDAEVLDLAEQLPLATATLEAARTVAKSARNVRRYDVAARWYRRAIELDPAAPDGRVGLAMTLTDAGDTAAADAELAQFPAAVRDTAPVRAARAYVRERSGAPLAALGEYDAILARDPADPIALRGKALALRALLLPEQALAVAEAHPGVLTDAEIARLEVDRLAVGLRLATRTAYSGARRDVETRAALARLDEALPRVTDPAARLALMLDRVVALVEVGSAEEAVAAFEALPATAATPTYALVAVSDAYRTLHRPEDSLRVLRSAPADAANLELSLALVYTWLDLEQYTKAFALADRLAAGLPLVNATTGSTATKGNPERVRAELAAGAAYAYGDQLGAAQARFERLLRDAPGNLDVRHELANVYRWRGWLDRSVLEYRRVLAVAPDLLAARIGYAYAQIDARDYAGARATVDLFASGQLREPAVDRLAREWRLHNRSELEVVVNDSDSTGPTFGSDAYRVDATWHSAPLAYRWRALAHTHDGYALFPEGDARRSRLGGGIEYRAPRFTASAELSVARAGGEAGVRGDLAWRVSDEWSLAALVDFNGNDVPLRGYRAGVETDATGVTATFACNELMSIATGVHAQRYSDGNGAQSLFVDGRYRFVNRPRSKLELVGEVATSRADRSDVVYYSPLRDSALYVGLHHAWRIHRRYERSVTQNVTLTTGAHDQAGFASGRVWRAQYALEWRPGERFAVSAGVERARQFFDGAVEHSTGFVATVRARL